VGILLENLKSKVNNRFDTRFRLVPASTVMAEYSNRDDALEKYLENDNEEFEQKDRSRTDFNTEVRFVKRCGLNTKSRAWKSGNLSDRS